MKILLFIPAFNCENQIARTLKKVQLSDKKIWSSVVVINNQSTDKTLDVIINYKKENHFDNLMIVSNSVNINLGGTHKVAFQYTIDNDFDGCIILHGDDQGSIEDIYSLQIDKDKYLLGARFSKESKLINYSKSRVLGNYVFNFFSSIICCKQVSDFGGSGLNYFPTLLLKKHDFWNYSDDLTFHAFLLLNIIRMKQSYEFFPVTWKELDQVSNVKLISQTIKLFKILIKYILREEIVDRASIVCSKGYSHWIQE